MADVTIAADFGASLGRAIYSTGSGYCKPELMLLDPQVVRVPAKSISNYEKYKIGQPNPEGGGIFARGRVPQKPTLKLLSPKELTIAVIMLGYRNSSILVIEKGELTRGSTGDFGFARMVQKIQTFTSGQKADILVPVICSQRGQLGKRVLETLARSSRSELRNQEVEEIAEAIADARAEYIALLQNWLIQHLPSQTKIDEFIISGGTARYLKKELNDLLKGFGGSLNWCTGLEERILKTFGDVVSNQSLESRLADVYGLFYKLHNRPLPRIRETTGDLRDANVSAV
ncbi:hypothetical protein PCC7424_3864 [Gloeothece citriformis PCC 7424]|uniref:Actin-like protein N-terminal domain-containing protein n=1 Tax=Gloeothece citriformis (strain PCC 7424) TaxID=65393 RepID=B7KKB0_GLOC7|nr:hypothetical protein [Gloeothece citriformis]ACK72243.1 hypothetical protein PCC7424_3864 [Gloeothece citriformis PCC 7424]